jgi:electron transfer flavoprotein alpha/beta subunit
VLAKAIKKIGSPDIVLTGMASTDGTMGVVPAMLAERLGLPQVTCLRADRRRTAACVPAATATPRARDRRRAAGGVSR